MNIKGYGLYFPKTDKHKVIEGEDIFTEGMVANLRDSYRTSGYEYENPVAFVGIAETQKGDRYCYFCFDANSNPVGMVQSEYVAAVLRDALTNLEHASGEGLGKTKPFDEQAVLEAIA